MIGYCHDGSYRHRDERGRCYYAADTATSKLHRGEKADILEEVKELIPNYQGWLDTENLLFQGRRPKDLIGTAEEERLRDVLRNIRYGGIA